MLTPEIVDHQHSAIILSMLVGIHGLNAMHETSNPRELCYYHSLLRILFIAKSKTELKGIFTAISSANRNVKRLRRIVGEVVEFTEGAPLCSA